MEGVQKVLRLGLLLLSAHATARCSTFIDATTLDLSRMLGRAHDADSLSSPVEAFLGDAFARAGCTPSSPTATCIG